MIDIKFSVPNLTLAFYEDIENIKFKPDMMWTLFFKLIKSPDLFKSFQKIF